jgi:iron-sulfur cluster assembly protein
MENQVSISNPVTLTKSAVAEVKKILKEQHTEKEVCLRLGVKGGGCSGMSYVLGFDEPKDADMVFYQDEVKIVLDKRHSIYLIGMEVNFEGGLNARGFTFHNPNAKTTCGCGTSFSA